MRSAGTRLLEKLPDSSILNLGIFTFCRARWGCLTAYKILVPWVGESRSVMSDSLQLHGLNSPGQNTGVSSFSHIQGIFPTQGSNPGLLYWRWIIYQLSHKGSPRIPEWVAYPFSSRSSWVQLGSHTLQADSLPTKLSGKLFIASKPESKIGSTLPYPKDPLNWLSLNSLHPKMNLKNTGRF